MKLTVYISGLDDYFSFTGEQATEMSKNINDSLMNGFPLTNTAVSSQGTKLQLNVDHVHALVWED